VGILNTIRHPNISVSKLVGTFDDPTVRGVLVRGDVFEGIVTRRQLATSHHQPNEKLGRLVWHVPRLAPDEDIRKVTQLMIDSDAQLLPVFDGSELVASSLPTRFSKRSSRSSMRQLSPRPTPPTSSRLIRSRPS